MLFHDHPVHVGSSTRVVRFWSVFSWFCVQPTSLKHYPMHLMSCHAHVGLTTYSNFLGLLGLHALSTVVERSWHFLLMRGFRFQWSQTLKLRCKCPLYWSSNWELTSLQFPKNLKSDLFDKREGTNCIHTLPRPARVRSHNCSFNFPANVSLQNGANPASEVGALNVQPGESAVACKCTCVQIKVISPNNICLSGLKTLVSRRSEENEGQNKVSP